MVAIAVGLEFRPCSVALLWVSVAQRFRFRRYGSVALASLTPLSNVSLEKVKLGFLKIPMYLPACLELSLNCGCKKKTLFYAIQHLPICVFIQPDTGTLLLKNSINYSLSIQYVSLKGIVSPD